MPVLCYTLSEVLSKYSKGKAIDLLSIDTEGYVYRILKSNDWKIFRPSIIITESNSKNIEALLLSNSYIFFKHTYIYGERLNSIYIESEYMKSIVNE